MRTWPRRRSPWISVISVEISSARGFLEVAKCQEIGLNVILCIGETLEERLGPFSCAKRGRLEGEGGKTDEVNKRQLAAVIPKVKEQP